MMIFISPKFLKSKWLNFVDPRQMHGYIHGRDTAPSGQPAKVD